MNRPFKELLMKCGALLLCVSFLLSGVLHDRLHCVDRSHAAASAMLSVAVDGAAHGALDCSDDFCPVCSGFLQLFLGSSRLKLPLAVSAAAELPANNEAISSLELFFHGSRAPPFSS